MSKQVDLLADLLRAADSLAGALDGKGVSWREELNGKIAFLSLDCKLLGGGPPFRGGASPPSTACGGMRGSGKQTGKSKANRAKIPPEIRQKYIAIIKRFYKDQIRNKVRSAPPTLWELEEDLTALDRMVRIDKIELRDIEYALWWALNRSDFWPHQLVRFARLRNRGKGDGRLNNGPRKIQNIIAQTKRKETKRVIDAQCKKDEARRLEKARKESAAFLEPFGRFVRQLRGSISPEESLALASHVEDWELYYSLLWPTDSHLQSPDWLVYQDRLDSGEVTARFPRDFPFGSSKAAFAKSFTAFLEEKDWPEMGTGVFKVGGKFFKEWIWRLKKEHHIRSMTQPIWEQVKEASGERDQGD